MTRKYLLIALLTLTALPLVTPVTYMRWIFPLVNSAPVASGDSYTLHSNGVVGSVLANDYDPDPGDSISASLVTTPSKGSLSNNGNGNFSYTRTSPPWTGTTDSFTYKACDNQVPSLCSSPVTVNITLTNQTPVAENDVYYVHGPTAVGPYMANDFDADGDTISRTILTAPSHGTLQTISQVDKPEYTPNSGFVGTDSFTYKVCDPFAACSAPATVFINVNDMSPIANADYYIVHGSANIGPMRENDYDPDGDPIPYFVLTVAAAHGHVYGLATPQYPDDYKQYVPDPGYTGTDSWQYRICDNLGGCSTATVYILVLAGPGPTIRIPYASGCAMDPCLSRAFNPERGGLPTKLVENGSGPSSGDPVNLATGRESYFTEPDLSIYNPSGPNVVWQRTYLSDQALAELSGHRSPGLTRGWVHNYDLRIDGTSGSWGALTLVYPNGATETLTPQLNGGVPLVRLPQRLELPTLYRA